MPKSSEVSGLEALGALTALALTVGMLALPPFVLIWTIETLSGHAPGYGFKTWLAAFAVILFVRLRRPQKA